jgi:N-acetylglutamate synthase-like GNAT family acetyltransferase
VNQGLQVCFTDPDYRGRGAGKLLMEWGVNKADEIGVESFVEASELGMHLYKQFGFLTVSEELVDTNVSNPSEEWKYMATRFPPHVA